MPCINHPNAPTAATCERCQDELCGMCAKFLDSGAYCDKCAAVTEAEAYVAARAAKLNRPAPDIPMGDSEEEQLSRPSARNHKDRYVIWGAVGTAAAMLFFSMLLYAYPKVFEFDPAAVAAREAVQALEDCRLVFEQIGHVLESGEMPDDSMRCPQTNVPNIVSRDGDVVTVSHPNPRAYGLSEISVSSNSHQVTLLALQDT